MSRGDYVTSYGGSWRCGGPFGHIAAHADGAAHGDVVAHVQ